MRSILTAITYLLSLVPYYLISRLFHTGGNDTLHLYLEFAYAFVLTFVSLKYVNTVLFRPMLEKFTARATFALHILLFLFISFALVQSSWTGDQLPYLDWLK